jgi:hypothetical protein
MGVMQATEQRIEGGVQTAAVRSGMWRSARRLAAVLTVTVALAIPCAATAEVEPPQYANDFGIGLGAVLIDLVYMPVKVVYATLGGLTGGFAFILTGGRTDIATAVWRPALGGTYVVTPSMLRGDEPINFSGGGDRESPRDEERAAPREEPLRERDRAGHGEAY